jgi:two-component SAPR family response regulator
MPAMNGLEFLTKVKNFRANIKTFLMTAFEVNDLQSLNIKALKINEFLLKPFSIQALNLTIDKHLSLKKMYYLNREVYTK